jgi:hypothetical protein
MVWRSEPPRSRSCFAHIWFDGEEAQGQLRDILDILPERYKAKIISEGWFQHAVSPTETNGMENTHALPVSERYEFPAVQYIDSDPAQQWDCHI